VTVTLATQASTASDPLIFRRLRPDAGVPVLAPQGGAREVFERAVGARSRAALDTHYVQADICRIELLVEIEVHGIAATLNAA
jgi:hypothetical protein